MIFSIVGSFRHKFLRSLLPFWSSALPTLPVTAPPRKDMAHGDDAPERRARHHKSSRMDPRKLLLIIAIMYCLHSVLISIPAAISFGSESFMWKNASISLCISYFTYMAELFLVMIVR